MDKLIAANLYRSESIPVNGALVSRYNQCLVLLGFKPTKLTSFSIDGMGWSPEIAAEKKDVDYLNNGDANPHAIIVTPLQKNKPLYMPFHTFDREIMKLIFAEYAAQISDITRDGAICVDLDQGMDVLYEPLDVLKYKKISISFRLLNDIDRIQQEQLETVALFNKDNNFIDQEIHEKLLASGRKYGDLRERKLTLKPLYFDSGSFYTRAFGGMYVLRDFIVPIVVFKSQDAYKQAIKDTHHEVLIYHIEQKELLPKLCEHVIVVYDLDQVVSTKRYERIKNYIFYEELKELSELDHPVQRILDDKMLFKSYLNKIDIESRKRVVCVERYLEKTSISNEIKIDGFVDDDFFHALHQPHSSLSGEHQDLIWKLLVNISPKDPLHLYWYDKDRFYEHYGSWDTSFKDWIITYINKHI